MYFFSYCVIFAAWGGIVGDWVREQNTIQNAIMGRRSKKKASMFYVQNIDTGPRL